MRNVCANTRKQSENKKEDMIISERKHDARYERFQCVDRGPPDQVGG